MGRHKSTPQAVRHRGQSSWKKKGLQKMRGPTRRNPEWAAGRPQSRRRSLNRPYLKRGKAIFPDKPCQSPSTLPEKNRTRSDCDNKQGVEGDCGIELFLETTESVQNQAPFFSYRNRDTLQS